MSAERLRVNVVDDMDDADFLPTHIMITAEGKIGLVFVPKDDNAEQTLEGLIAGAK